MDVKVKRIRKASVAKIIGALSPKMVEELVDYSQKFWRRKAPIGPPKIGQHKGSGLWPEGTPGQYRKSIKKEYVLGALIGRVFTEDPGAQSTEYGTKSHAAQPAFRLAKEAGHKKIRAMIKKIIKEIRGQSVG